VRPAVPVTIERALLRALERFPADRFDSVSDFATALRGVEPSEEREPRRRTARLGLDIHVSVTVR